MSCCKLSIHRVLYLRPVIWTGCVLISSRKTLSDGILPRTAERVSSTPLATTWVHDLYNVDKPVGVDNKV